MYIYHWIETYQIVHFTRNLLQNKIIIEIIISFSKKKKKKQNSIQKFFLSFYLQPTFNHRGAITQFLRDNTHFFPLPPFSLSFRLSFYHRKTPISSSDFFFLSPIPPRIPDYWLVRSSISAMVHDSLLFSRAGQSSSSLRAGYTGGNTRTSVGVYIIHI